MPFLHVVNPPLHPFSSNLLAIYSYIMHLLTSAGLIPHHDLLSTHSQSPGCTVGSACTLHDTATQCNDSNETKLHLCGGHQAHGIGQLSGLSHGAPSILQGLVSCTPAGQHLRLNVKELQRAIAIRENTSRIKILYHKLLIHPDFTSTLSLPGAWQPWPWHAAGLPAPRNPPPPMARSGSRTERPKPPLPHRRATIHVP